MASFWEFDVCIFIGMLRSRVVAIIIAATCWRLNCFVCNGLGDALTFVACGVTLHTRVLLRQGLSRMLGLG